MRTNEAPEKIYLLRNSQGDLQYCWRTEKEPRLENIEYIRSDILIEREIGKYLDNNDIEYLNQIKLIDFAKHFYEFGLKTRK